MYYYPTALRRVQITPKTSSNVTRYLYSEDQFDSFSRNARATNWTEVTKKKFVSQNEFLFYLFS